MKSFGLNNFGTTSPMGEGKRIIISGLTSVGVQERF